MGVLKLLKATVGWVGQDATEGMTEAERRAFREEYLERDDEL